MKGTRRGMVMGNEKKKGMKIRMEKRNRYGHECLFHLFPFLLLPVVNIRVLG